MSSIRGSRANAYAYIEGVLIPISSWTTQAGVAGAASCVLSVNPSPGARRLLPGSMVVVLATDPIRTDTGSQVVGGDIDIDEVLDSEEQRGLAVVFEGRLISRGLQSVASGARSISLSCKGVLLDWEQTKQYWADPMATPGEMVSQLLINNFSGVEAKWDPGVGLKSFVLKGLRAGDVSVKGPKAKAGDDAGDEVEEQENFLEHILNIVEAFGNSGAYYSANRNRFRLTDRVAHIPAGASLKQLFAVNTFAGFYKGTLQRLSGMSTLMSMVNILLEVIHHDVVELGVPSLVKRAGVDRNDNGTAKTNEADVFQRKFGQEEWTPVSVLMKPRLIEQAPPSCNVIFPDVRMEISYSRSFVAEPTRQQAFPTTAFFENDQFIGIKKMQPEVLAAFCNHNIVGNAIGSEKTKGASTTDGARPEGDQQKVRDFHFLTNEEKFRGVVYNHIASFPTPGKLSPQEADAKSDDINEYADLVLRAQYLKSRYQSRAMTLSGPLNIRAVPGFPILVLDDSGAGMHMLGYLLNITHTQDAAGADQTVYQIAFPRELLEEDLNAPIRVQANLSAEDEANRGDGAQKVLVKKGDTLNEIGARFGLAPKDIAALNPQLLGRAYTQKREHIPADYDPKVHGAAWLTDYDYIIPGDEIIIVPAAAVDGPVALADQARTRHPIKTVVSEFGVAEYAFNEVDQPEVPSWFANPWRNAGDAPASLSQAYRALLGAPVVACTHSGDNVEFDSTLNPFDLAPAADAILRDLADAERVGNRAQFVDRYTRRRLVTPAELFAFLGATPVANGEIYDGGPFVGATENYAFEDEQWGKLLDGVEELVRKVEANPSSREDEKQRADIQEAERVMSKLRDGTLSYPMTFQEVYDARRQRALNYRLELLRKQGFRG